MSHLNAQVVRLFTLVGMAVLAGCGGAPGGGGGGTGPALPPIVPGLVSISITPSKSTVELDETVHFQAIGTFDDASQKPVTVAWSLKNGVIDPKWSHMVPTPAIASLNLVSGPSVIATACAAGTVEIEASVQGLEDSAQLTATWDLPADPGPIYGSEDVGGRILRYASDGGLPTQVGSGQGTGLLLSRDGTALYHLVGLYTTLSVQKIDLLNGNAQTEAATFTGGGNPISMDDDASGAIFTFEMMLGALLKCPPGAATFVVEQNAGRMYTSFSVGPDGSRYFNAWFQDGLYRFDAATGNFNPAIPWASLPQWSQYPVISGLATNRRDETFAMEMYTPEIYKCVDRDGDGSAQGPNETTVFGRLPGGYSDNLNFGLCSTRGGGVIVNVQGFNLVTNRGIYWFRDMNNDGDALDLELGERVLYNPNHINNAMDAKCIACPR